MNEVKNALLRQILLGVEYIIPTDEELGFLNMGENENREKCDYCGEFDARYVLDTRSDRRAPMPRNEGKLICKKCFDESEVVETDE